MGQFNRILVLELFFALHEGDVEILLEDVEGFIMSDSKVLLPLSTLNVPQLVSLVKAFLLLFKLNLIAVLKKMVLGNG